ncbi:hypothetical protein HUG17_0573 [Dermatophagoides farinae]|uniref:Uncharacterized protein n=1 Tax=Dermatophagoides farinae TaxID=6954 RepID=A0A9D4P8I6_DERFA|nr:hypothetical protein HUG17_0573 [Dermatophagoides farinae]
MDIGYVNQNITNNNFTTTQQPLSSYGTTSTWPISGITGTETVNHNQSSYYPSTMMHPSYTTATGPQSSSMEQQSTSEQLFNVPPYINQVPIIFHQYH